MKKCIQRSVMWTSFGFSLILIYCISNIIFEFSYLDLAYLFVVIYYFVLYLKRVKEL